MNNNLCLNKIKSLVNQINQECFNNQLIIDFPILISNTSKAAGDVRGSCKKFLGEVVSIKVTSLRISKNFQWTDAELKNTIAHELIHVYEIQVLKINDHHGYHFVNKMNEINKISGYNVTVKHRMPTTKVKKDRKIKYVISEKSEKVVFVSDSVLAKSRYDINFIKDFGSNCKIGEISFLEVKKAGFRTFNSFGRYYCLSKPTIETKIKEMGII